MRSYQNIVIALAGIAQAVSLVHELANHGNASPESFNASINSIYKIDANSITEVYGELSQLRLGIAQLERLFTNTQSLPKDVLRYFMGVLTLTNKVLKDQEKLKLLRDGLETISKQVDYFSPFHETVIANLAELYKDVFGTYRYRIIVTGKPEYMQQADIMAQIRALLLAAIRSAVLWQQMGGRRWQFLLARKRMLKALKHLQ